MAEKLTIPEAIEKLQSGDFHVSSSSIKALIESPLSYMNYLTKEKEDTDAMVFGKAGHCLLLEPEKFDTFFQLVPKGMTKAKANESHENEDETDRGDKVYFLTETVMEEVKYRVSVIKNNAASRKILEWVTTTEAKVEFEYNGIKILGYVDGTNDSGSKILELKFTVDARPRKFMYQVLDFLMYVQAGLYQKAFEVLYKTSPEVYTIASSKNGNVAVYKWDQDFLDYGIQVFDKALQDLKNVIEGEYWYSSLDYYSGNSKGIYLLEKPNYL